MHRIYEPADGLEGERLVDMLAGEGIDARLLGGYLLGALGELPLAGLLAIQVADADALRARALIAAYNSARPLDDSGEPGGEPGVLDC